MPGKQRKAEHPPAIAGYWAIPVQTLLGAMETAPGGLSQEEAARRLERLAREVKPAAG